MPLDVRLGRLRLPTVRGEVTEPLGDELEAVGAVLAAAERRPRSFELELPVSGDRSTNDRQAEGARLRRQLRALLNNASARLNGLYFQFTGDPDLDSWIVIGGGDLTYGDGGGPTFQRYTLKLRSTYRVATPRTHRPGRRVEVYDRRRPEVAIDTLGRYFGPVWPNLTPHVWHALGVGVSDVVGADGEQADVFAEAAGASRRGARGAVLLATGRSHGDILHFEQSVTDFGAGDVVLLNRATPAAPESEWEEVYGPDQALAPYDLPVMDNGLVRVRWLPDVRALAVDRWSDDEQAYVERGRVLVRQLLGPDTYATVIFAMANVVHWTPERAVVRARLTTNDEGAGGLRRLDMYITLQAGRLGPRVEVYAPRTDALGIQLRWSPATSSSTSAATGYTVLTPSAGATRTRPAAVVAALSQYDELFTETTSEAYGTARTVAVITGTNKAYVSGHYFLPTTADGPVEAHARSLLVETREMPTLVAR